MIRTKDLIKVYKTGKLEVIALRGVDLEIGEGEIAAIRGPSGCGKTTLLNLLGGLDRPTAGQIEVEGVNTQYAPGSSTPRKWPSTYFRPRWYSRTVTRPTVARATRSETRATRRTTSGVQSGIAGPFSLRSTSRTPRSPAEV